MINGRQPNGRFAPGAPGGPGRPTRVTEESYLAVIRECVTLDDFREIARRALADAKRGDSQARQWLSKYLVGDKPLETCPDDGHRAVVYVPDNSRFTPPSD